MRTVMVLGALLMGLAGPALAEVKASQADFGVLPDGAKVQIITLQNSHGVKVGLITLGATVQSVVTPNRKGKSADLALGYPSLDGYVAKSNYFGVSVGRFANRIAKGKFTLDGTPYSVTINDGPNSLHGGTRGFDKYNWTVLKVSSGPAASVTFGMTSPDGDQGYPGKMTVTATYSLNESNELSVEYQATTDKPTIVNLTNHTYWNLAGEGSGSVLGQRMTIKADAYTPIDATLIPTGEIRPVAGTAFDFRRPKAIGRDIRDGREQQLVLARGYDHNWVVSHAAVAAPRLMARVEDPKSGRVMELLSDQPGLQFYSGNFLDATIVGKAGRTYRQGDAFALEPQLFPDAPNQPAFASARLAPGQTYRNRIVFRFSVAKGK